MSSYYLPEFNTTKGNRQAADLGLTLKEVSWTENELTGFTVFYFTFQPVK